MGHEPYHLVPAVVTLPTLTIADDIGQVIVPVDATIHKIVGSLRTLTSGTFTVAVKNSAGSTIGTLSWTAAGTQSTDPAITSIAANDKLRIGVSSLGIGFGDCVVTVWLKMPSTA